MNFLQFKLRYLMSYVANNYYPKEVALTLNSDGKSYIVTGIGTCKDNVIIPSEYNNLPVTSIDNGAFNNCESLESVTIDNGVTSIGNYAFMGCSNLARIEIPDSVTSIGFSAFNNCESLESVVIPDGITNIYNYTFCNCSRLTSVTIPNSVTSIGENAFNYCDNLTSVYYKGTENQWNNITINIHNSCLTNATIYYNS